MSKERDLIKKHIALLVIIFLTGCTTTQKGAATGGVAGATLGGIIGHQSDNDLTGAAIGGVVGTVGGMIVGEHMAKKFCPVGGEEYPEDVMYCPKHGVELKYKEK